MKKALITGISGQDGSYLSELLLEKGYEVHGIIRRHSVAENQDVRIANLNLNLHYGDLTDEISLYKILKEVMPDEIYNLAAMSHVGISNKMPSFTIKTNSLGVLNLLEFTREICPDTKFYQASSSEMFGNSIDDDNYQRVGTPMHPVSPYGCSKLLSFNLTRYYREAYNMFTCNGILFNHESSRRGSNFVTNKIIKSLILIKKGYQKKLYLGNLNSSRDWGHAKDYVRAMYMILNHSIPNDWIVSSGASKTVRDFCKYAFGLLNLNYEDYVVSSSDYKRPLELDYLRGDSTKIRKELGWKPIYTFETMIEEMVEYWDSKIS